MLSLLGQRAPVRWVPSEPEFGIRNLSKGHVLASGPNICKLLSVRFEGKQRARADNVSSYEMYPSTALSNSRYRLVGSAVL